VPRGEPARQTPWIPHHSSIPLFHDSSYAADVPDGQGQSCETKPICPGSAARAARPPPPGTSTPNKANSAGAVCRASTLWKKSYGEFDMERALAKQSQSLDCGLDTDLRRDAPCGLPPRTRAGRSCKTNPICLRTGRQGRGWSQSCETKPILPPNRQRGLWNRAKRTQFAAGVRRGKYFVVKDLW
jgi:hypothetical protein